MDIQRANKELIAMWLNKLTYLCDVEKQTLFLIAIDLKNDIKYLYSLYDNIKIHNDNIEEKNALVNYLYKEGWHHLEYQGNILYYDDYKFGEILGGLISIMEEILPLGSVVELTMGYKNDNNEQIELIITQRFVLPKEDRISYYFEYGGVFYPTGMLGEEKVICFTNRSIKKVIFRGLKDEKEEQFIIVLKNGTIIENDYKSISFSDKNPYLYQKNK